mmetsp:Transcript_58459/g.155550  ORF Transcript_58459/g.155550 Transcript_58459/m.155550 type:complete len:202 (+) Transcript_58459:288-893(+)
MLPPPSQNQRKLASALASRQQTETQSARATRLAPGCIVSPAWWTTPPPLASSPACAKATHSRDQATWKDGLRELSRESDRQVQRSQAHHSYSSGSSAGCGGCGGEGGCTAAGGNGGGGSAGKATSKGSIHGGRPTSWKITWSTAVAAEARVLGSTSIHCSTSSASNCNFFSLSVGPETRFEAALTTVVAPMSLLSWAFACS